MSTLTREHRQALADIGGWPISGCLHSPDTAIPHLRTSMQGGSQLGERWPRGTGYQCGPRGIRVGTPTPRARDSSSPGPHCTPTPPAGLTALAAR